jgi:hypothetical protein
MAPHQLVTATVEREDVNDPIGLTLKEEKISTNKKAGEEEEDEDDDCNTKLLIQDIDPNGPVFGTSLRLGMELKSINNIDCSFLSAETAMELLQAEAYATILAELPPIPGDTILTATVTKPSVDAKVGVGIGRNTDHQVVVTSIADGSLAALDLVAPRYGSGQN